MPDVFFSPADDTGSVPADPDAIARLMRERAEDYWNDPDGSGFADLSFYADGKAAGCTSKLVFTKSDRHGFHFWLSYPVRVVSSPHYRKPNSYFSCSAPDLKDVVPVRDSHEGPRSIFTGLFIPVDAAIEVVREFVRSGGMSDRTQWLTGQVVRAAEQQHGLA